jgi:hypothetical protein
VPKTADPNYQWPFPRQRVRTHVEILASFPGESSPVKYVARPYGQHEYQIYIDGGLMPNGDDCKIVVGLHGALTFINNLIEDVRKEYEE